MILRHLRELLFLMKYRKLKVRYRSFSKAIHLAVTRNVKNIIETGTAREEGNWKGDGLSTILFGDFCKTFGARVTTCDISRENIEICRQLTEIYKDYITYITGDSVQFLKNYDAKIDFLYLDSFDSSNGNVSQAQEHNLAEIKSAEDKLHENTIILIDDYKKDPSAGKGALTVPYLLKKGWKLVHDDVQAILIRK
jgi:predicted O-methyltransferase YrrM